MSTKKSRSSSKSKAASSDADRDDRPRRSSKDYRTKTDGNEEVSSQQREKSKSKHSTKSSNMDNDDAAALAAEEEERRRRKKELKKLKEEEERKQREQEEYEEERRRRKEKEREQQRQIDEENSKKHKSSKNYSPQDDDDNRTAHHSSSKHKSKFVEKDDNYSDDFEQNYDEDFDDEPPPVKKSTSHHDSKSRSGHDNRGSGSTSKRRSSMTGYDDSQVISSSVHFQSQEKSDKIRRRYRDLSRLIILDRQSFDILEMAPMPAHAMYMRDIRASEKNASTNANETQTMDDGSTGFLVNAKTQTNDDAENVPSQTDEIDTRSMWTQHPSETQNGACGSGSQKGDGTSLSDEKKIRETEDILRMLRVETDLTRYQNFVVNAGRLMLALLNEDESSSGKSKSKKSKENDENEGMQKKSDLSPFSGMTLLNGLSFKSVTPIAAACFFHEKPEQVAIFYEPIDTTSYGAIFNVRNPEKPMRVLTCEASISCCGSADMHVFAGCHDGSVVLFDTSEPNRYKPGSKEPIPSSPAFSTANIQFNHRHFNQVIRVLPLRMTNKGDRSTSSYSLASLDRDGLIIIWSVVELLQSNEIGSIADLGLKPGGKVRMTQTSSMQIKQSINMFRDTIQTYDMTSPMNEIDHLYVATNSSAVYHMTRSGEMGSPGKLRLSSDFDSQVEVTCLSFNPMVSKLLLVGTGHGQLYLYSTGRDEAIVSWPDAFPSSSTVLSCAWSVGRPSVFFAHDSLGQLKYWDLSKDIYQAVEKINIPNLQHFILSTSNQHETAFALVVRNDASKIEIHQLKASFATHSDSFVEKFKAILKEILSNA